MILSKNNISAHSPGFSLSSLDSTGSFRTSVRCSFSVAAKACVAVTFLESRLIWGVLGSNFMALGKWNEACENNGKKASTYWKDFVQPVYWIIAAPAPPIFIPPVKMTLFGTDSADCWYLLWLFSCSYCFYLMSAWGCRVSSDCSPARAPPHIGPSVLLEQACPASAETQLQMSPSSWLPLPKQRSRAEPWMWLAKGQVNR